MRNKTGKGGMSGGTVFVIVIAVLVLAMAGLAMYYIVKAPAGLQVTNTNTNTGTPDGNTGGSSATFSCPSDDTTDGQVRYLDTLAATNTYGNPTVYFESVNSEPLTRITAGTLATDGTYSTAVDMPCTSAGNKWRAVAVAKQDYYHSAVLEDEFVSFGPFVQKTLKGKSFGKLQIKVKDLRSDEFFNVSTCGTESADFVTFNGSKCVVESNTNTGAMLTLGADGYISSKIYVKTNATRTQYGEDGLRTWFLVDANSDVFDEPVVARNGGSALANSLTDLTAEDKKKYSGYEYAYEIGSLAFSDDQYINFYLGAASLVNPGASDDPTFEFCSESRYNSVQNTDKINIACWTDAASQAQVSHSLRYYAKFDVS